MARKRLCFVLMPFKESYRQIYDVVIKPTMEDLDFECVRADDIRVQRNIMRDVIELIDRADVIVADLTGTNPNVFYELGVSHALAKQTVVITQSIEDVPFDLRPYRTILYTLDFKGAEALKTNLRAALGHENTQRVSNPVTDFLPTHTNPEAAALRDQVSKLEFELSNKRAKATPTSDRRRLLRGVEMLAEPAAITFGPLGRKIVVHGGKASLEYTKDIIRIGRDLDTGDPIGDIGARLLIKAIEEEPGALHPRTLILLTSAILVASVEAIESADISIERLRKALEQASRLAIGEMRTLTQPFSLDRWLSSDDADKRLLRQVTDVIGSDGTLMCELSESERDVAVFVQSETLNAGYANSYFVTDPDQMEAILEDAYVFATDLKLVAVKPLLPLLEQVARSGRPLLIIAPIEGEALATLVVNKLRGTLNATAVTAKGFSREKLKQLAAFAGMQWREGLSEADLEGIRIEDLGQARKVVISKDKTTILGRDIGPDEAGIDHASSAILRLAVASQAELSERKKKIAGLSMDLRTAFAGVVPGGGVTFLRSIRALTGLNGKDLQTAARILISALYEPSRALFRSAGLDEKELIQKLTASEEPIVYNILSETFEPAQETTFIDSASSTFQTLEAALRVANTILTGSVLAIKTASDSPPPGNLQTGGENID